MGPVSYGDVCNHSSTPDRPYRPHVHRCDASLVRRRRSWWWTTPQDTALLGHPSGTRAIIRLLHQSGKILAPRERREPSGGEGHFQREWPEHHHKGSPAPRNTNSVMHHTPRPSSRNRWRSGRGAAQTGRERSSPATPGFLCADPGARKPVDISLPLTKCEQHRGLDDTSGRSAPT